MQMSMDLMAGGIGPEVPISPPLSRPDRLEPHDKSLHATEQHKQPEIWEVPDDSTESHDSTSPGPSSAEPETNRDDGGACNRMIGKWDAIKRADRNEAQKKVYRTDDVYRTLFGKNYSRFYEAFRQGISTPEASQPVATAVPAKRHLAAPSERISKRRRQDDPASLPQSDHHEATRVSAQPAAVTTRTPTGAEPSEVTSPPREDRESPVRPTPRSYSATKDQPSRRKGVGLYAGNWEYVTDEEKIPEYLSVAEKIADVEGRTTRRAYAKLTSNESPRDTNKLIRSSFENKVRKSGRARNTVDYARLSTTEGNTHEGGGTREQSDQSDLSATQEAKQTSPSTPASSTSDRSMLMTKEHRRLTSKSTAQDSEQLERPKLSWNAIVYEILALADAPLTFGELMQDIRDRFPFFKAPSQEKVLKSGLKNPLYFHEAFIKGDIIDGKQTWGLKPGKFVDKKTGEVLTPQPRNPIRSPGSSAQVHQESPTPSALTPNVSHSHRPRSSNPRFGREILNSPEIPDSQDAMAAASSPQESLSRIGAEYALRFEEPTSTQKVTDGKNSPLSTASPDANLSVHKPQSRSHWPTSTSSPVKSTWAGRLPIPMVVEDRDIRKLFGPIDREASAKAAQPRAASIPSSNGGEDEHHSSPAATLQVASTPIPPVHAISPRHLPALNNLDGAANSETSEVIPATLTPSVTSLPDTQLLSTADGKAAAAAGAGAKENSFIHLPRWA